MITIFQKTATLLLSFLVLVASSAFSATTHYCGKRLVSFEINQLAPSCCAKKHQSSKKEFQFKKESCCLDLSFSKEASNEIIKSEAVVLEEFSIVARSSFSRYNTSISFTPVWVDPFDVDTSPSKYFPHSEDKTILFQVFLI